MNNKMHEMLQKVIKEADEKNMDIQEAIQKFTAKYNMGLLDDIPNTPKDDAYELLDKAYEANTKSKAKKYAKKALEVCPDLFDAKLFLIDMEDNFSKKETMLNEALKEEKEKLTDEDFFEKDCIGHFYGIFETRPYIRGLCSKAMLQTHMGKMKLAIKTSEEIIRLNESDNTGTRYMLMALYAYLEDEKNLLKLYKKYDEEYSMEMIIPLMVYYYKQDDIKNAKRYLKIVEELNPNFIKFYTGKMEEDDDFIKGYYRSGSPSEVISYFNNYGFLLLAVPTLKDFIEKNK